MLATVIFRAAGFATPRFRMVTQSGYDGGAEWRELRQALERHGAAQELWIRPEVSEWLGPEDPHIMLVGGRIGRSVAAMGQQEALKALTAGDGALLRQLGGIMAVDVLLNHHQRFPLVREGPVRGPALFPGISSPVSAL